MAKRGLASRDVLVKLIVGAGQASPSPPVGPALGSKGVKSMDFCKEFNARTAHYLPGTPIPALVTVRPDRSFTFTIRTPPTATLLLTAAGVAPVKNRLRGAGNTAGPSKLRTLVAAQVATVATRDASAAKTRRGGGAASQPAVKAEQQDDGAEEAEEEDAAEDDDDGADQAVQHMYAVQATGKASGKDLNGNARVGVIGTVSVKHIYEIARIKAQEDRLAALGLEKIARSIVAQAGSMGVAVVP